MRRAWLRRPRRCAAKTNCADSPCCCGVAAQTSSLACVRTACLSQAFTPCATPSAPDATRGSAGATVRAGVAFARSAQCLTARRVPEQAFEPSQRYKVGCYILEKTRVIQARRPRAFAACGGVPAMRFAKPLLCRCARAASVTRADVHRGAGLRLVTRCASAFVFLACCHNLRARLPAMRRRTAVPAPSCVHFRVYHQSHRCSHQPRRRRASASPHIVRA